MKLPDFLEFEPFNRLREAMGAERLGQFELFDPKRHLTADELQQLRQGLLPTRGSQLRVLKDLTLAFKNARVWVDEAGRHQYHLSNCSHLAGRAEFLVSASEQAPRGYRVCAECLQRLNYQSFDAVRQRHRHHSEKVLELFELQSFYRHYPCYPLAD